MIILSSQPHLFRFSISYLAHSPYYQLHWRFFWYLMTLHLSYLQIHFHSFRLHLDLLHFQNQIQRLEAQGLFCHLDCLLPQKLIPLSFYLVFPILTILLLFKFIPFHLHFCDLYYLFHYLTHLATHLALLRLILTLQAYPLHFLQLLVQKHFKPFQLVSFLRLSFWPS